MQTYSIFLSLVNRVIKVFPDHLCQYIYFLYTQYTICSIYLIFFVLPVHVVIAELTVLLLKLLHATYYYEFD